MDEAGSAASPLETLRDPHSYLAPDRGKWLQLLSSNPASQPGDLALTLAVDRDTVVGRLGFYAGAYCVSGRSSTTFWMDGFALQPEYRASGIGGVMLLEARKRLPSLLASGGPDESAQRLYRAAGLLDLGRLLRFVHVLRAEAVTSRLFPNQTSAALAGTLASPFLWMYNRARARILSGRPACSYRPVQSFEPGLDRIFDLEDRHYFRRDTRTLNWILGHRDFHAVEIYEGNGLEGYCLLKIADTKTRCGATVRTGLLVDFYLRDSAIGARLDLLKFATAFAREREALSLICQVRGDIMSEACLSAGMTELAGNHVFFRPHPRDAEAALQRQWFLTNATSDVVLCV